MSRARLIFFLLIFLVAGNIFASGHGPLFSLSTPTNASNQWSVDFAALTIHDQANTGTVFRTAVSYGFTESLMVTVAAPFIAGETESLTPALGSFEATATWRFQ